MNGSRNTECTSREEASFSTDMFMITNSTSWDAHGTEITCCPIQVACGSKAINPRAWPGSTQTYFFLYRKVDQSTTIKSQSLDILTSHSPPCRLSFALPAEDSI
jgi:hypothetical protein